MSTHGKEKADMSHTTEQYLCVENKRDCGGAIEKYSEYCVKSVAETEIGSGANGCCVG